MTPQNNRPTRAAVRLHPTVAFVLAALVIALAAPAEARPTRRSAPATDTAQVSKKKKKRTPRVSKKRRTKKVRKTSPQKKRRQVVRHKKRRTQKKKAQKKASPKKKSVALANGLSKKRKDIVTTALAQQGKPYHYASKGPSRFDCSGLTHYVMKQHGVTVTGGSRHQIKQGKNVSWRASRPGDLVFFRRNGKVAHVGVVVDNTGDQLLVVHATSRGVVVDDVLASSYWRPQLYAARNLL